MKFLFILVLTLGTAWAGETWNKTKAGVNKTADDIDRETQKTIDKGKAEWNEHEQKQKMEEEKKERKEYERLKKKYGN
jgi:formylmethanofuran dehydrogenase subunit A